MSDTLTSQTTQFDLEATIVSDVGGLLPYPLPGEVSNAVLDVAREADVLVVGEMHGTAEVPSVIGTLLSVLKQLGYGALALEFPSCLQEPLEVWASDPSNIPIPRFFAAPDFDGRGNTQALGMVAVAVRLGLRILCFDKANGQSVGPEWKDRDAQMAHNLQEQHERFSPGTKVVAICGNMHSRLAPAPVGDWREQFWPSFAAALQSNVPNSVVRSLNIVFHSGTFYNCGVREGGGGNLPPAPFVVPGRGGEHTLDLHLPYSTAASFLKAPPVVTLPV